MSLVGESRLAQAVEVSFEATWLLCRQRRLQIGEGEIRVSTIRHVCKIVRKRLGRHAGHESRASTSETLQNDLAL